MKKKFIAFNKDDNKMWSAQDLLDNGYIFTFDGEVRLESFCGTQGDVCNEFTVYQYIHRKDKDGNKVYEGSLIKWGKHTEAVLYNKEKSRYTWGGWQFESLRGFNNEAEVIGHIAEEGVRE